jgi:hypothetical protein
MCRATTTTAAALAVAAACLLALPAYAADNNLKLPDGVIVADLPRIVNLSAYGIEREWCAFLAL